MRKMILLLTILVLLPFPAQAREGVFWTVDGYRSAVTNAEGESLMLGELRGEKDGFTQIVGVMFTIFAAEEHARPKWSTQLGGDGVDKLMHAADAGDGWIAVGSSSSSDLDSGWHPGDYDGKEGKTDGWVVRLDAQGEVLWTRSYGGSDWDSFQAICPATDGGWILVGNTHSADGDVEGWHDSGELFRHPDAWMVHIDAEGNILWEQAFGGSDHDEFFAVRQTPDGYLAVGTTGSEDGDVQGLIGGMDGWAVLVGDDGTLLRQGCYGGPDDDDFTALSAEKEGHWLAAGTSWSFDEDDTERAHTGWAVSLDAAGDAQWTRRFGSNHGVAYVKHIVAGAEYWVLAGHTQPMGMEATDWILGLRYSGDAWTTLEGTL